MVVVFSFTNKLLHLLSKCFDVLIKEEGWKIMLKRESVNKGFVLGKWIKLHSQ